MAATLDLPLTLAPPAAPSPRAVLDADGELSAWLTERRQPAHRIKQIRRQILVNRAESFETMTDLPATLRQELGRDWSPLGLGPAAQA